MMFIVDQSEQQKRREKHQLWLSSSVDQELHALKHVITFAAMRSYVNTSISH